MPDDEDDEVTKALETALKEMEETSRRLAAVDAENERREREKESKEKKK